MFKSLTLAATLAATLAVMPSVASAKGSQSNQPTISAQNVGGHYKRGGHERRGHLMSAYAVQKTLYRHGFRNVRIVGSHGYHAVAYAHGRRGPVKLTVDRKNGAIVGRQPLGVQRHHGYRSNNGFGLTFRFGH